MSNQEVHDDVRWAVDWAVDWATYWDVDLTVSEALFGSWDVDLTVSEALFGAVTEDSSHPGLQGFLSGIGDSL